MFELTPEGIKRADEAGHGIARKAGRKLIALIVVVAALAGGLLVFRFLHSKPGIEHGRQTALAPEIDSKSIAVLPFENLSEEKAKCLVADTLDEKVRLGFGTVQGQRKYALHSSSAPLGRLPPSKICSIALHTL